MPVPSLFPSYDLVYSEPITAVPGNAYEQGIVDKHSTPGLRRQELCRASKKDHLAGLKVPAEEAEKILEQLYGNAGPPKG